MSGARLGFDRTSLVVFSRLVASWRRARGGGVAVHGEALAVEPLDPAGTAWDQWETISVPGDSETQWTYRRDKTGRA